MADGSALLRRYIGRQFAELRKRAGISQEKAADELQRARETLARIERGDHRVRFRDIDVRAMLALYSATPEESERMLALTRDTRNGHRKSWLHDYTETALPKFFAPYVEYEAGAETIRQYEAELVPGLLQTRAYARAVMSVPAGYVSDEEIGQRVSVRMERQALLAKPRAPHLDVILNEAVLCRSPADPAAMAEQLQHLLDASRQTGIKVRVLPWAGGIHAGMSASGAFKLLDFPIDPRSGDRLERPLAYVDTLTGAIYLNKPDEVRAYRLVWDDLAARALDESGSRDLITTRLEEVKR